MCMRAREIFMFYTSNVWMSWLHPKREICTHTHTHTPTPTPTHPQKHAHTRILTSCHLDHAISKAASSKCEMIFHAAYILVFRTIACMYVCMYVSSKCEMIFHAACILVFRTIARIYVCMYVCMYVCKNTHSYSCSK